MSFIASALGGQNNYTVTNGLPPGTQANIVNYNPNISRTDQAYQQSNQGLSDLAAALKQQMAGNGPSLSNQLLQNATAQNVATQAALQAGQRGASTNAGLVARNAGMIGANAQQQAVGQAASNRLQEQLGSEQLLGNTLGTQGSLASGFETNLINANNTQNGMITGANLDASKANAGIAQSNTNMIGNALGGVGNAVMGLAGLQGKAQGGEIHEMIKGPMKFHENFVSMKRYASGGTTVDLPFKPMDLRSGGPVVARTPAEKAVAPGNNRKNDKIPAMVSEGEVVIDRETLNSKTPVGAMARAVAKHISMRNKS